MNHHAARLAWILWGVDVALIALWLVLADLRPFGNTPIIFALLVALISLVPPTVGALILSRRPGNAIGWILYGMGVALAVTWCARAYVEEYRGRPASAQPLLDWQWVAWIGEWIWLPSALAMLTFALLLFPDGHLPSRRWRPLGWLAATLIVGLTVQAAFAPSVLQAVVDPDTAPNPARIEAVAAFFDSASARVAGYVLGPLVVLGAVATQVVRLRHARGAERQQLKWFAYLSTLVVIITGGGAFTGSIAQDMASHPLVDNAFWFTLVLGPHLGMPMAIGIAIFRYQLYDVDLVINRTLVYLTLTASLGLIYVGSVLLAQTVTRPLTQGSDLSVAAATLAVAALFRPARHRIQGVVDRRFFRSKYDAARTLNAFTAAARDEVDLDRLAGALVAVVDETVQPAHVALWVRDGVASREPNVATPGQKSLRGAADRALATDGA
ncbi:MAG: hypothetical protein ACRDJW_23950 [Thermomicrobiales bacterium]